MRSHGTVFGTQLSFSQVRLQTGIHSWILLSLIREAFIKVLDYRVNADDRVTNGVRDRSLKLILLQYLHGHARGVLYALNGHPLRDLADALRRSLRLCLNVHFSAPY